MRIKKTVIITMLMALLILSSCGDKDTSDTKSGSTNVSVENNMEPSGEDKSDAVTKAQSDEQQQTTSQKETQSQAAQSSAEEQQTTQQPAQSQTTKPQATQPQTTTQQPAQPQTTKPQATQPQTTGQQPAQPQTTKPQATQPQTTTQQPATTQPSTMSYADMVALSKQYAVSYRAYYEEVLRLVNEIRAEAGVAPLQLDDTLCQAAGLRSIEMDYNNEFSHTRPDGSSCFTVLSEFNCSYHTCGENIAAGYASPAVVVNGWKNSQGHYENMINASFTKLGVGYSSLGNSYYGNYWTQLFTD
ncbi:MAG: hypothetical protein IIX45_00995 [Lachnospiraceae bacterium]|nr:hypothetical protein [Lachnospiraceae bacterium]